MIKGVDRGGEFYFFSSGSTVGANHFELGLDLTHRGRVLQRLAPTICIAVIVNAVPPNCVDACLSRARLKGFLYLRPTY